jgi:transposase-like protein
MKTEFEFKTLTEFTDYFCDEETCRKHYAEIRFGNGGYCPHCGHKEIYTFKDGKRYRCASCKQDFTIKTGTVFGESKLPLRKWFIAIYLLSNSSKGISSVQLAKHVGVTQKTAWFMAHRIREAHQQNKGQLTGRVEADETWIGGKVPNMSKSRRKQFAGQTGGAGKTPLVGILQRGGDIQVKVADRVTHATLVPNITENVARGSFVYTDENVCYRGLHRAGFIHNSVQHQTKEYVVGDCHTNGIESFWALFKRGYHGVYHHMSKKHLQRYVNEFTFRFNRRANEMQSVFSDVVARVANSTQLPYKTLIQKPI